MSGTTAEAHRSLKSGSELDVFALKLLIVGLVLSCSISYRPLVIGQSTFHHSLIYWDVFFVLALSLAGLISWLVFGPTRFRAPTGWISLTVSMLMIWCGISGLLQAEVLDFFAASLLSYMNVVLISIFAPSLLVRFGLVKFSLDAILACSLFVSLVAVGQAMTNPSAIFVNITSTLNANRSHIGLYMLTVLGVGLFRGVEAPARWRTAATALAFLCILICGSRAALIGSVPVISIYFFRKLSLRSLLKLIAGLVILFFVMDYIVETRQGLATENAATKESSFEISNDVQIDASAGRRILMWVATWNVIRESEEVFWRGFGFTNYRWESGRLIKLFFYTPAAHNVFLHMWAETGLIGLLIYLSVFLSLIVVSWNLRRAHSGASLLIGLSIGTLLTGTTQETFFPNEAESNFHVFFIFACLLIAINAGQKSSDENAKTPVSALPNA